MTRRQTVSPRLILAVVAFGVFVAADDLTVVSTMLRQIIFDLQIPLPDGLDRAAWIVNAYLIGYVVVMPFTGRLSDIVGRRAVYVGALGLFLAGSIWVPLANSLGSFIVGRILTAVGGGAMVPVAMAVIGDVYPAEKRATALGTLGAIDTAGWVWGPLYGALLIRFLSWRWQFYLNIPLSLLGMAAAWWALGGLPRPQKRERIDWAGTAVFTLFLLTLNLALLNGGDVQSAGGFASLTTPSPLQPYTPHLYAIAALALAVFILWQHRLSIRSREWGVERATPHPTPHTPQSPAPLLSPTLFRRPNFTPAVLINFLVGSVLIIAMVNVPLLVNVLELDVEQAALISGYLLAGMTLAMACTAYLGGRLTERHGYRPVTMAGLALAVTGFGLMGSSWAVTTPFGQMGWQLAVLGLGFGLVTAPIGTAVINTAPPDQRGIAASLVIVLRLIGMSVGLSGLTAWGLRRFATLRTTITLPDLPLTDPTYQRAVVAGLTAVTTRVLAETFLWSAGLLILAMIAAFWLHKESR
ncbi:MAG: MFS transporter [Chloroflexota bacterium]